MPTIHDLIVIGTGMAGLSAARHASQNGLSVATLEASFFGGLVLNINHLDGEPAGSGSELASNLMMEVSDLGAQNIDALATGIAREGNLLRVDTEAEPHRARAVIVASGARIKRLGVPGEADLIDQGVSQCADCDGPMYQQQDVVVVGGGDSAVQEAAVLAGYTRHVHLIHRGDSFTARAHLVEQLQAHGNLTIHWHTTVEAILGAPGVEGVRLLRRDAHGGTTESRDLACGAVFAYVGLEAACGLVPASIERDAHGRLVTDANRQTAMAGVYAAGAVRAGCGGMLQHAIDDGIAAATAVVRALRD